MKTAEILKKSVLTPGNNWISLLNSANLSKKNAVTPVNFHLYHYAGNNPIKYTDPDGRDTLPYEIEKGLEKYEKEFALYYALVLGRINSEVFTNSEQTYRFNQRYFCYPIMSSNFGNHACYATSILNIVAAEYKKETGYTLSFIKGLKAMKAAIACKAIDKSFAYVSDPEAAANAMAKAIGLKGKFKYEESLNCDYVVLSLERGHFVNCLNTSNELLPFFDVWDSKSKSVYTKDEDDNLITKDKLETTRPYRGFNYEMETKDNE